jgi:cell division protein FtsQ
VAKTSANGGGATLLDDPRAEFYRPAVNREVVERTPRPSRASAVADEEAGEPFLRTRRRVPVRKGLLPSWAKTRWGAVLLGSGVLAVLAAAVGVVLATRNFLDHDPHFRIPSAISIQTVGNSQLTRDDLLSVFGRDLGRNLFLVPLSARQLQIEQFSWVEHATVMRVLPNQLRVAVIERTPVAFVQIHGKIELVDAAGVILEMTPQEMAEKHYSFPVVSGINPGDPLSVRAARMDVYQRFIGELDSNGEKISSRLSEVDLSDAEDVRATVPGNGADIELQFGQDNFLARWRNYEAHIAQWRAQYPHLMAADLRYEHEVVLKMAPDATAAPSAASTANASPAAGSEKPTSSAKKVAPAKVKKAAVKPHSPQPAKHTAQGAR